MSQQEARTFFVPVRQATFDPPTSGTPEIYQAFCHRSLLTSVIVHPVPYLSNVKSASLASTVSLPLEYRDASRTAAPDKADGRDPPEHLLPRSGYADIAVDLPRYHSSSSVAGLQIRPETTNIAHTLSRSTHAKPSSSHNDITGLIDSIVEHQEDLRDAREKIIGERVRLRNKRRNLKGTREKAAVQAGIAIDFVKRYFLETGAQIPQNIQDALEDVNSSRDRLGEEELEYEIAEQHYDFAEWEYTEKEQIFVDDVLADGAASYALRTTSPGALETMGVSEYPLFDPGVNESHDNFETTAYQKAAFRDLVSTNQTSPPLKLPHMGVVSMTNGEPSNASRPDMQLSTQLSDENRQKQGNVRWSITLRRIEEWLLEHLQISRLNVVQLRSLIPKDIIEGRDFWELVTRNWSADSQHMPTFHSGDTIASNSATSEPISAAAIHRKSFDDTSDSDIETSPTEISMTPLVSLDRVKDALGDVFPSEIDAVDLLDAVSEGVTPVERTASSLSGSSQFTVQSSTSPSACESSMTGIEEDCLYTPSTHASTETVRLGEPAGSVYSSDSDVMSAQVILHNVDNAADPAPTIYESGRIAIATDDMSRNRPTEHSRVDVALRAHTETPYEQATRQQLVLKVAPHSTPNPLIKETSANLNLENHSTSFPGHPSCLAFIWIDSPDSWALPLLRLMPELRIPSTRSSNNMARNSTANLPFVSAPQALCRLPGPSTLPQIYSEDM